jgi:NADPH-dependent 2,4-dienoyl-CoA reductase/sulfur reductase-like enzyme
MKRRHKVAYSLTSLVSVSLISNLIAPQSAIVAAPPRNPDKTVNCEILVVGGGLSGVATAYEGLLAGRTVCLTEITDWLGGQISSQGTSASPILFSWLLGIAKSH